MAERKHMVEAVILYYIQLYRNSPAGYVMHDTITSMLKMSEVVLRFTTIRGRSSRVI